ncbi:MAG: DUF1178 family protein [Neomegalonema sp.]|nr:DUF1178 family protein [Neomegalonema sp.]
MIKYTLSCEAGCRFEAWFQNSAACDSQLASGHVACPTCGRRKIVKSLMAPNISTTQAAEPSPAPAPADTPEPTAPAEPPAPTSEPSPEVVRRALEERLWALRSHIESSADNVGDSFAAEARRIHEGESEERPIYGDATSAEIEDLVEDGVPIAQVPWINRRDD